jgi:hypothetical protein
VYNWDKTAHFPGLGFPSVKAIGNTCYAIGNNGSINAHIFKSTDGGYNWFKVFETK